MKAAMTLNQLLLVTALIFGGLQFVPVERTNPPVQSAMVAPQPVTNLLRRACYDCHSNETVWPWYGKVAPFSWLVAKDVNAGREKLNFSNWNRLSLREQEQKKIEIWQRIKSGDMPPPFYILGHPDGRVSTDHHALLRNWSGVDSRRK